MPGMAKNNILTWNYLVKNYTRLLKAPQRPCRQQLSVWRRLIKQYAPRGGRALVLGSTPEFRDLTAELGIFTWVIDINPKMLFRMTALMKSKKISREKRITGNWLKVELPKNYFDVIFAEASLNNLSNNHEHEILLKKIASALKPSGIFLCRNVIINTRRPTPLGRWYRLIDQKKLVSTGDFALLVRGDSSACVAAKSPFNVDSRQTLKPLLADYARQSDQVKKFIDIYRELFEKETKYLFVYSKIDFERLLKKYFNVKQLKTCRKHYACQSIFPSYLLKKKYAKAH